MSPYATPLREEPTQRPRRSGLLGLFGLRRSRASASAENPAAASARPAVGVAAPRTATSTPQHAYAGRTGHTAPNSPPRAAIRTTQPTTDQLMRQLLNIDTANPHQPDAVLGRQLVAWRRAMQAEIGQYRQASGLNTYGTTPAEHLDTALHQIWSARPSREAPSQTIDLVTASTPRLPDEMFEFIHLKAISVLDCGLRELSSRIGNLSALESLHLTHNPGLATLPVEVATCVT